MVAITVHCLQCGSPDNVKNGHAPNGKQKFAAKILDRFLHHATMLNIKGEIYRLKDKRRAGRQTFEILRRKTCIPSFPHR